MFLRLRRRSRNNRTAGAPVALDFHVIAGRLRQSNFFSARIDVRAFLYFTFFRYLDCLKELPPALRTEKFEGLLPFAELARFNKKELKRYRYIMHLKWDRYAQELAFAEDHPDFVKKIEEKVVNAIKRNMRKDGVPSEKIQTYLNVLRDAK